MNTNTKICSKCGQEKPLDAFSKDKSEKFDLSDKRQQKIACNYLNLQPMWALENIVKSDKIL